MSLADRMAPGGPVLKGDVEGTRGASNYPAVEVV